MNIQITSTYDYDQNYILTIKHSNTDEFSYLIDKTECPISYSYFLALIDYIDTNINTTTQTILNISIDNLIAYNILQKHLKNWKLNNWITARGKAVAYPDILDSFITTIQNHNILYTVKFIKILS